MAKFMVTSIFNRLKSRSKSIPPIPEKVWQDPLYFIGFGFGAGAMPFAPGTFGTLMAIPFYLLFRSLPPAAYLSVILIFILFSSYLSHYLSKAIHEHDHPGMCIDEFVGYFVTMSFAPHHWTFIVLGFVLFRLFDIWKPWPIGWIDKHVTSGFGMVLDDVLAGFYSFILLQGLANLRMVS